MLKKTFRIKTLAKSFKKKILLFFWSEITKMFVLNRYNISLNYSDVKKSINFNTIKNFWILYGLIAFMTTTFSYLPVFQDILTVIYLVFYVLSIIITPISLYLYWKNRSQE